MFDNVFETKENKIQTTDKTESQHKHKWNIRSKLSCKKEKKAILKHEYNMLSSHMKRSSVL